MQGGQGVGHETQVQEGVERWSEHTKSLPDLELGQHVMIQNQRAPGNQARKWDRTGVMVDCPGYDKYSMRVDGSGRVTDRNRKYLRAFTPDHLIQRLPYTGPVRTTRRRKER